MEKQKYIYALCLMFCFISSAEAAGIFAAKRSEGETSQFKDFTSAEEEIDISFRLEGEGESSSFELLYSHSDKTQKVLEGEVGSAETIFFPAENKFININKPGLHRFDFIFDNSQNKSIAVYISEKRAPNLEKSDLTFKDDGVSPIPVNYQVKNSLLGDLKKYKIDQTRSSGSKIYRELAPSVPLIVNEGSIGTGSVLTSDGVILTNWHVIEGASEVQVVFKPEKFQNVSSSEHYVADVVKFDVNTDLALIKLRRSPANLKPIKIGTLDDIEVAIDVHAIGHPKGNFWTYTRGVVSQLRPNFEWGAGDGVSHQADIIQTQTPINPGNSGGPLFNDAGIMIGVNSFVDPTADGLNFAVAVSTVRDFFQESEKFKRAKKRSPRDTNGMKIDLDEDGFEECTVFDEDGNGIFERVHFDRDADGRDDELWFDEDQNEIIELQVFIVDTDEGPAAIWYIDNDQDGVVEAHGYDFDMDGELDKVETL